MKNVKILGLLLLTAFSLPALAADPVPPGLKLNGLFKISSDRDSNSVAISAMIDDKETVAGFYGANSRGLEIDAGEVELLGEKQRNVFYLAEIEGSGGAVLATVQGKKALILSGRLDRRTQEGKFTIRFLTNGIFNKYDSCDFYLRKNGARWAVQNAYNRKIVTRVKVITHSVGITTLEGICPAKRRP